MPIHSSLKRTTAAYNCRSLFSITWRTRNALHFPYFIRHIFIVFIRNDTASKQQAVFSSYLIGIYPMAFEIQLCIGTQLSNVIKIIQTQIFTHSAGKFGKHNSGMMFSANAKLQFNYNPICFGKTTNSQQR